MKAGHWKSIMLFAAVIAVAGGLRFWDIGAKSLWLDEAYSEMRTRDSFDASMEQALRYDGPPPLYPAALWFWRRAAGCSEAGLRSLSAVCDILTVAVLFFLLLRLFGKRAAFAGAILYAFSGFAIYFAQEARHYSLFNLLASASTLVFLQAALSKEKPSILRLSLYAALLGLTLYAMQYGLFVIASHAVCLALLRLTRRGGAEGGTLALFGAMAMGALLFAPYLPVVIERARELRALGAESGDFGLLNICETFSSQITAAGPHDPGGTFYPGVAAVAAAAVAAAVLAAAVLGIIAGPDRRRRGIVLGSLTVVPFVCVALLPFRPHEFEPKHLIFLCPLLLGATAAAITRGIRRRALLAAGAAAVLAVIVANGLWLGGYFSPEAEREDWRGAAAEIFRQARKGDAVLFLPSRARAPFERYLPEGTRVRAGSPPHQPMRYVFRRDGELIDIAVFVMLKGDAPDSGLPEYYSAREMRRMVARCGVRRLWIVRLSNPVARLSAEEEEIAADFCAGGKLRLVGYSGTITIGQTEKFRPDSTSPNKSR